MEVGLAQPEEPSESEKPEKFTYLYTQHGRLNVCRELIVRTGFKQFQPVK